MNLSDNFFKKVENKTNVKKTTIMSLAKKLQGDNMKNPDSIRDVIQELSKMTGKEKCKIGLPGRPGEGKAGAGSCEIPGPGEPQL